MHVFKLAYFSKKRIEIRQDTLTFKLGINEKFKRCVTEGPHVDFLSDKTYKPSFKVNG